MLEKRVPIGLQTLDAYLGGGVLPGSVILLKADPSNFTEAIALQFIVESLRAKNPAIYLCVVHPPEIVIRNLERYGLDIDALAAERCLMFVDLSKKHVKLGSESIGAVPIVTERGIGVYLPKKGEKKFPRIEGCIIKVSDVDDKDEIEIAISAALGKIGRVRDLRLICESTSEILTKDDVIQVLRFWKSMDETLRRYDFVFIHIFPHGPRDDLFNAMSHHADGVIELRCKEEDDKLKSYLIIKKMRGTTLPVNIFELVESEGRTNVEYLEKTAGVVRFVRP
ncbi:MAG: RAD55 family ATPase [Candidatus Thermoplasmatota archaeon]